MLRNSPLSGAICGAALFCGVVAAAADSPYDRKLERAVMAIVAKKVGPIRGSLSREWQPTPIAIAAAADRPGKVTAPAPGGLSRSISASIELFGPETDKNAPVKPGRVRAWVLPRIMDGR